MSEETPSNSYLFFSSNRGTKLNTGIFPMNDTFLHIFATSEERIDSQHPVTVQFCCRLQKFCGRDVAHFSIHLTKEDARKLVGELLDAIPLETKINEEKGGC